MSESQLSQYITKFGQRLKLQAKCKEMAANKKGNKDNKKESLLETLRRRMNEAATGKKEKVLKKARVNSPLVGFEGEPTAEDSSALDNPPEEDLPVRFQLLNGVENPIEYSKIT